MALVASEWLIIHQQDREVVAQFEEVQPIASAILDVDPNSECRRVVGLTALFSLIQRETPTLPVSDKFRRTVETEKRTEQE